MGLAPTCTRESKTKHQPMTKLMIIVAIVAITAASARADEGSSKTSFAEDSNAATWSWNTAQDKEPVADSANTFVADLESATTFGGSLLGRRGEADVESATERGRRGIWFGGSLLGRRGEADVESATTSGGSLVGVADVESAQTWGSYRRGGSLVSVADVESASKSANNAQTGSLFRIGENN